MQPSIKQSMQQWIYREQGVILSHFITRQTDSKFDDSSQRFPWLIWARYVQWSSHSSWTAAMSKVWEKSFRIISLFLSFSVSLEVSVLHWWHITTSVANLATFQLNLATYQLPIVTFFYFSKESSNKSCEFSWCYWILFWYFGVQWQKNYIFIRSSFS